MSTVRRSVLQRILHLIAMSLIALLLAACGSEEATTPGAGGPDATDVGTSTPGPADPESPVGCGPGPTPQGYTSWEECPGDDGGPRYELVEQRDGLVDPRPVDWLRARPREDGVVLRITFWSGVEECYGVAEVIVDEQEDAVVVTIIEGRVPEAEVCIEVAVKKAIDVELSEPVGDRDIVDGAE